MASVITATAHGLAVNDPFTFANTLPTDSGVTDGTTYYVITVPTADTFTFSDTLGGTEIVLAYDITSADIVNIDEYVAITEAALDPLDPAYDARLDSTFDSALTAPTTRHVTHSWPDAPGQPQNFTVAAGYKGLGGRWDATSTGDLMFYEFRYAPDDGTGTAPNTTLWVKHQVKTSVIFISGLTIAALYWCQVRSVDFTGQVVTSGSDATPVDYLANPEAGWTTALSVTPTSVPQEDVAFNSVLANIVSTNSLDASTISTGTLRIDTADATLTDGIRVYDSGTLIGFWDETGLYIGDAVTGIPVTEDNAIGDLTTVPWVKHYDAGITVFDGTTTLDVLNSTGINAGAITRGTAPGGPNLLKNGSFEMADFLAPPSTKVWTATADFTGTKVSGTNDTNSNNIASSAATSY